MKKLFNTLFPFSDFLYILQQEEYSSSRLLHWFPRFFFRRGIQIRQKLVWTSRAQIIGMGAISMWTGLILTVVFVTNLLFAIPAVIVITLCIPIYVLIVNTFTSPLFELMKEKRFAQARKMVERAGDLTIVAVAGSYGKTTIKQYIYEMCRYTKRTQLIEGNINTPLGIADWVIKNVHAGTEILIVEMDTYGRGEIQKSCSVTRPHIAILSNIGDQHLERFSGEADLAAALGEVFTAARSDAVLVTDTKTLQTLRKHTSFVPFGQMRIETVETEGVPVREINMSFAVRAAEILRIPTRFRDDAQMHVIEPDRRKRKTNLYGYDAIDDSYNISLTTATASLQEARKYADSIGKKLLVITAGIPEISQDRVDSQTKLGKLLQTYADHIYVLGSMYQQEICEGITDTLCYTRVINLQDFASQATRDFAPTEYMLLMLPELTDLYY
jgi:UDP-N-acetylmuramoyl-tripeptide--D-alanyl-D-alanine ligase